jgi:hypothetical protein
MCELLMMLFRNEIIEQENSNNMYKTINGINQIMEVGPNDNANIKAE